MRGEDLDELDDISHRMKCRGVVLWRLFDLYAAAHADKKPCGANFGGMHEREFWSGLRDLADQTIEDSEKIAAASNRLSESE